PDRQIVVPRVPPACADAAQRHGGLAGSAAAGQQDATFGAPDRPAVDRLPGGVAQPGVEDLQERLRVLAPGPQHRRLGSPEERPSPLRVVARRGPRGGALDGEKAVRAVDEGPRVVDEAPSLLRLAQNRDPAQIRPAAGGPPVPGADLELWLRRADPQRAMP